MLKRIAPAVIVIAFGSIPFNTHTIHIKDVSYKTANTPVAAPAVPATTQLQPIALADLQPLPELEPLPVPVPKPVAAPTYSYSAVGTFSNTYDYGQCTWGVASMKQNIPSDWGNAAEWVYHAKLAGYTTSSTPVVGAVGVSFLGYYGHVVVVTGLNPDGSIQITETNYDGFGDGLHRTRTADVSEFEYIYI